MQHAVSNFVGHDLAELPSLHDKAMFVHKTKQVIATRESLEGFGTIVESFDAAQVDIVTWPRAGWRPIVDGTGNEGGVVEDVFEMQRVGGCLYAVNHAVERRYITGWYEDPAIAHDEREPQSTDTLYTHEANYHPDGGQIFFPRDGEPFVALLAKPGDDIRPQDFVAFYFDGSFGVQIYPNVWHQPLFPQSDVMVFNNKQGRVHACVSVDFIGEFQTYLAVPLEPPA